MPLMGQRRGGDSNPRYAYKTYAGLANRCIKPLCHLSNCKYTDRTCDAGVAKSSVLLLLYPHEAVLSRTVR